VRSDDAGNASKELIASGTARAGASPSRTCPVRRISFLLKLAEREEGGQQLEQPSGRLSLTASQMKYSLQISLFSVRHRA
jgi:hypothetical protein